jgi:hypothetical protein
VGPVTVDKVDVDELTVDEVIVEEVAMDEVTVGEVDVDKVDAGVVSVDELELDANDAVVTMVVNDEEDKELPVEAERIVAVGLLIDNGVLPDEDALLLETLPGEVELLMVAEEVVGVEELVTVEALVINEDPLVETELLLEVVLVKDTPESLLTTVALALDNNPDRLLLETVVLIVNDWLLEDMLSKDVLVKDMLE